MTDTKQVMQQALDALCLPCDRWNGEQTKIINAAIEALRGCLTAPAAEVPEAMGEEQIVKCLVEASCIGVVKMSYDAGPYQITRPSINADKFARAIIAARDAQWQSTRLRGGAPDVDDLAQFIRQIDGNHRMGAGALAEHICEWLTAAPQAPAAALDADGEAFRTAARLGLTLRFHGGCAQSGMPGSPSAYEVITGADPASSMRQAVRQAAAVIEAGGEPQRLNTVPALDAGVVLDAANPYPSGSMREGWQRGYEGRPMLAHPGSDYARAYDEGQRAAMSAQAGGGK